MVTSVSTLTNSSSCLSVVGTEGLCILGGAGLLAGSLGFGGGFAPECVLYRNDKELTQVQPYTIVHQYDF